jgi:DNA modification methylase
MKDNSSTKVENSTDATIAVIPCYVPCGLELNRIYNESNLDTMKRMPDNFVDLTVTSPPYDNLRDYKGYSFPFEDIAKELYRVTKEGGVVVWVVGDATKDGCESLTSFKQAIYFVEQCGFKLHDTMIYEKETLPLSHKRYEQHFEYMFVFVKGKLKTFNGLKEKSIHFGQSKVSAKNSASLNEKGSKQGGKLGKVMTINEYKLRGNIWKYETGLNGHSKDEIAFKHPAIFPEKLCADHIYTWSNEGEIVYDCFGGSGTTAKMAHLMKRNWILSEISSEYVQIAEKRIAPYLAQTSLF